MKTAHPDRPPQQESFTLFLTLESKEQVTLKLSRKDAIMLVNNLLLALKDDMPSLQ